MKIITSYQTNAAGRGQIVAKSSGKQRTHNYDSAFSAPSNHGHAAGLLVVNKFPEMVEPVASLVDKYPGYGLHDSNEAGTRHTFLV